MTRKWLTRSLFCLSVVPSARPSPLHGAEDLLGRLGLSSAYARFVSEEGSNHEGGEGKGKGKERERGDEDEEDGDAQDGKGWGGHASTLQTLLAILEPPAPPLPDGEAPLPSPEKEKERKRRSKPVVFVLDAFDLFAQQARQSFLYCLLDCVQSGRRAGGVMVVGLTSRTVRLCFPSLQRGAG